MNFFKYKTTENNGIPGKTKIHKTVEKYRKPGQTHIARAIIYSTAYTESLGLVYVEVQSFDGIIWEFVARLKDMIELHQENKLNIINLTINKHDIEIQDGNSELSYIIFKNRIKTPNIKDIPVDIVYNIKNKM